MKQRLQKCIAQATGLSRRKAEELINEGCVTVNGTLVTTQGVLASLTDDIIVVNGKKLIAPLEKTYLLLHKPVGYITSRSDPNGRKTVMDLLPPFHQKLFPVGRLDYESEGLLLLTDDGEWANEIIHPRYEVEKEYEIWCTHPLSLQDQRKSINGIQLEDGIGKFLSIRPIHDENTSSETFRYSVIVEEGRNRFIRRMIAALQNEVIRLIRLRIGRVQLNQLPEGEFRPLSEIEIQLLQFKSKTQTRT